MELVQLPVPETERWKVRVVFENGMTAGLSDVVGVNTDDPDFIQVNQANGDYLLVFHTGRPQFMEVIAE